MIQEAAGLRHVLTGAIGMLLAVRQCALDPVPYTHVQAALDSGMLALRPRCRSSGPIYEELQQTVNMLKAQLTPVTVHGS